MMRRKGLSSVFGTPCINIIEEVFISVYILKCSQENFDNEQDKITIA